MSITSLICKIQVKPMKFYKIEDREMEKPKAVKDKSCLQHPYTKDEYYVFLTRASYKTPAPSHSLSHCNASKA